jgi:hypothetical protein
LHANITSADPEQAQRFVAVAARLGFRCRVAKKQGTTALTYAFAGGIRDWLRSVGIAKQDSHFKTIPDWVFRGSQHQVRLFVGAYFSCDGTVSPKGMDRNGEMQGSYVLRAGTAGSETGSLTWQWFARCRAAFQWRDRAGTGYLVLDFAPDGSRFAGFWWAGSNPEPDETQAGLVWDGRRVGGASSP